MLNRIINIAAGFDFKGAAKQPKNLKYGKGHIYHMYDGHDSINISPAYNFLMKHNWKILDLNVEDEKLFIGFIVSGFEFNTVIHLKQINQLTDIEYNVAKEKEIDGVKFKMSVDLIVNLSRINYDEVSQRFDMTNLESFFNRLVFLKLKGELTSADRKAIDGLLEGLAVGMQNEFDSINNGLFIFIEKYFSYKISSPAGRAVTSNSVFVMKIHPFVQNLL